MSAGLPWLQILLAAIGGVALLGVVFWIGWRESRRPFPEREDFPVETGDEDPPLQRGPRKEAIRQWGRDLERRLGR